ncbi:MAG: hypothetical protein H0V96_02595 [Acidimicrobiia bacterium]|nr:hypothetical protein [Acidimicrobiia bacterium]
MPGGTGSGGNASGSGQGDDDEIADPERGAIFDPPPGATGEEERVDFDTSDPTGQVRGRTIGEGLLNAPLIPYADRYLEYRAQALDALDRMTVPASMQDLVRLYFTELGP